MTPQLTPVAEKALAFGKVLEFSVRPMGFHSLYGSTPMFGLSVLSLMSLNSAEQGTQTGSNQLGQPEPRQLHESAKNGSVGVCESNCGGASLGAHVSSKFPPQNVVAGVSQAATAQPSLFKSIEVSDATASKDVAGTFLPDAKALPLQWVLTPRTKITLHTRILAHLVQAQAKESNASYRQDYGQAFVCVSLAERGNTEPFLTSSYTCYGLHPDKVWPAIVAKRRAKLGKEYSDIYDAAGNLRPDLPKKPQVSSPDAAERSTSERLAALIQFQPKKETA